MSTEAHEPASPTCDALQKVGEQCTHPQQTTVREAAEAVTKGFAALEVLLAAQDADIPDAEPLWVKVSGRREEIATYGQLRALRRALNLAHPQQGGERDGWKAAYKPGSKATTPEGCDDCGLNYCHCIADPVAQIQSSKSPGEEA